MAEVATLDDYRPHMSGGAVCMECRHQWQAVAPIGTFSLDCPSCGLSKGAWQAECLPEDRVAWTCGGCGNHLFYMTETNIRCSRCGAAQSGMWDDG